MRLDYPGSLLALLLRIPFDATALYKIQRLRRFNGNLGKALQF